MGYKLVLLSLKSVYLAIQPHCVQPTAALDSVIASNDID
jgi:hypothetical protein